VSDSGVAYSNPALFAQRRAEWLACIESSPGDVNVLEQAADFVALLDPALAQDLYQKAEAIEPDNPRWILKLAQLHSRNAQRSADPVSAAKLALAEAERALAMGSTDGRLAQMAFDAGDMIKARAYAEQFLSTAPTVPAWNAGNLIHKGNLVLGRIAVRDGRIADAVRFLGRSGDTPGSPQLNSFGPNMALAKDLLEAGETSAVLDYFERCRGFWKSGGSQLDRWTAEVREGKVPNFGANLQY
jgi:tetratricopeptide (TPR) repeat protein